MEQELDGNHPPVRAWRCFDVIEPCYFERDNKPYLASPMNHMGERLYPNQVYYATCNHTPWHDAPQFDCTCGFYAFKRRADARKYLTSSMMAEVLLGGKIIETELGYRAEQMIIVKLYPRKGVAHGVSRR
jgi:hypothetical protein